MRRWLKTAPKYGIITVQCDRISRKNSTDMKLCVEIMKNLYTNDTITMFYIITTDSDFRHVVSEIRLKGKKVYCIGSTQANPSLKSLCTKYIEL